MKKLSLRSLTLVPVLSMGIILSVLPSCRCLESLTSNVESQDVQVLRFVDTIYQHDSIFIREIVRGDTVYLTRTEWRDRWRTQLVHDTIIHTDSIVRVIEHPPERYVPQFDKGCTIALWAVLALAIGYVCIKLKR